MTMQEAYETMREWMVRPGASRAVQPGTITQCMYITPDGNKCIVGCLLGPETLNNLYDAYGGLGDLMDNYHVPELEPYMDEDFYSFLENAQRLHDSETSWEAGSSMCAPSTSSPRSTE